MPAMSCKLNSLFSIGEDFDDEDLLGTDWAVHSGPARATDAASPCGLRAPSAAHAQPETDRLQPTVQPSAAQCHGPAGSCSDSSSSSSTHTAAAQTAAQGLRQLSSSYASTRPLATLKNTILASPQSHADVVGSLPPPVAQDDFDDWDVDLADLEECDGRADLPLQPPPAAPVAPPAPTAVPASTAKALRPPSCGKIQTLPDRTQIELCAARQPRGSLGPPPRTPLSRTAHVQSPIPRPPRAFPDHAGASPLPSPISRPHQPQRPWSTPGAPPRAHGLFETVSPTPSSSSMNPAILSPHPIHTPFLTNRLVQLVSASNKLPRKRPRSEPHRPRTRRFPGPAGLLPQQPQGQSLDDIVVAVPHIPAHGVVARLPSQVSGSQSEEDEFGGGAWAAMKAEMGLDERNPSCFLHSYSVVMVLRKAALKQLAKNKVPNMAVLLKSLVHTHADAKAVFKDPTGEIQGTVHRCLLEDRVEELRVGVVLLLKQVGVFSPSHRNHYLNVTPNNLLRIYTSDGVGLSSSQLPPLVLEPVLHSPTGRREPISRMHLVFDEEEDERPEGGRSTAGGKDPEAPTGSTGPQESAGTSAPQDPGWDADDDFDELLGELPEDTYSL